MKIQIFCVYGYFKKIFYIKMVFTCNSAWVFRTYLRLNSLIIYNHWEASDIQFEPQKRPRNILVSTTMRLKIKLTKKYKRKNRESFRLQTKTASNIIQFKRKNQHSCWPSPFKLYNRYIILQLTFKLYYKVFTAIKMTRGCCSHSFVLSSS